MLAALQASASRTAVDKSLEQKRGKMSRNGDCRIAPFRALSAPACFPPFFDHETASTMPNRRTTTHDNDAYKREVGARLRLVRQALGLPAGRLAAELGVHPPRLSQWEHGRHLADLRVMVRLARRYRVPLDFVYLGDENMLPKRLLEAMRELHGPNTNP
jgi:hypothetical protein